MRINKKVLLIILTIITVAVIAVVYNYSLDKERVEISEEPLQDEVQDDSDLKIEESFITLYSKDGQTKWELGAMVIKQYEQKGQAVLEEVTANVYEQEEKVISLVAEEGVVDLRTGFIELKGPITVRSKDKLLRANKLNFNSAKNELIGIGDVLIKQSGLKISGDKFISQVDLNRLRIIGNVKVISREVGEDNE